MCSSSRGTMYWFFIRSTRFRAFKTFSHFLLFSFLDELVKICKLSWNHLGPFFVFWVVKVRPGKGKCVFTVAVSFFFTLSYFLQIGKVEYTFASLYTHFFLFRVLIVKQLLFLLVVTRYWYRKIRTNNHLLITRPHKCLAAHNYWPSFKKWK